MSGKPTVVTVNLFTGYTTGHRQVAVSDEVNETLLSGELTALLGPNGCGKSTLLKTLSGFIPPLKGSIKIDGRDISSFKGNELSKVIGVVLTERVSMSNMNVRDLVALGRSPYTGFWGRLSASDRKIVDEAIKMTGIENLASRNVATLSDGERQKAMISKALAQETQIIFLDEPSAFLDYPSKVELMQLLKELARNENKTIFLSTHDLDVAIQISDRLWLMDKKLGIKTGTPDQLSENNDIGKYFNRNGLRYDNKEKRFIFLS